MPPEPVLRALIVDDEEPARELLRDGLDADPGVTVVGEAPNGFEAVRLAAELKPDLLFLDVQMPKLDGFEALELIGEGPDVIFVTAYDEHALRAFEVHAVDYLLKPFAPERLAEALARARRRRREREEAAARPPAPGRDSAPAASGTRALVSPSVLGSIARAPGRFSERVVLRDGAKIRVIPVATIEAIEAEDDYVRFHSAGSSWLKQQTLGELEKSLDPAVFVRVHRSWIVNVERLARIEPWAKDSHVAILADGRRVPVSRSGYARLRALL